MNDLKYYRSLDRSFNKIDASKNIAKFKQILGIDPKRLEKPYSLRSILLDNLSGYTICLGLYETRNIILDIDNNPNNIVTCEEIYKYLKEYNIYISAAMETLSSTLEHPRYRLVFQFNEKINKTNYKKIATVLCNIIDEKFNGIVDKSKTSINDAFYPCSNIIFMNDRKINNISNFICTYDILCGTNSEVIKLDYLKFFSYYLNKIDAISNETYKKINDNSRELFLFCKFFSGDPLSSIIIVNKLEDKYDYRYYISTYLLVLYNPRGRGHIKPGSWTSPKTIFHDDFKTIVYVPLTLLLNKEENVFFQDIFGHKDVDGKICSATIQKNKEGKWYYWQHIKNHKGVIHRSYDIFDLIQKVYSFDSCKQAIDHIKYYCNLKNYDHKTCVENIQKIIKEVNNIDKYKNISKLFDENEKRMLLDILKYCYKFQKKYYDERYGIRTQIIRPYSKDLFFSQWIFYKTLKLACTLGILEKVFPEKYNKAVKDFLSKKSFKENDVINKRNRITSVFYIPIWHKNMFKCINEKLASLNKINLATTTVCRSLSNAKKEKEIYVVGEIISKLLSEKKYFLRKELENNLRKIYPSYTTSQINSVIDKGIAPSVEKYKLIRKKITRTDIKKYKVKTPCIVNSSIIFISA